jgi:hypothetical protein
MTREQSSELNTRMAELNRQFKRRIEQIEHEHVMRLMATFQEFKARTFAIKNNRPSPEFYAGGNGDGATSAGPDGDRRRPQSSVRP